MKVYAHELVDFIEYKVENNISTFGGESYDLDINSYGIQLGYLTLDELSSEQMKTLGIAIINHLAVNGHRFELGRHQDGQYIKAL
jgi:hypothetical protein